MAQVWKKGFPRIASGDSQGGKREGMSHCEATGMGGERRGEE